MDNATRHLSSPSPTSSFLFHHTENSYKSPTSDILNPLLSSETEDSDVNACFSNTSAENKAATENISSNQSDENSSFANFDRHSLGDCRSDPSLAIVGTKTNDHNEEPLLLGHFSTNESAIDQEIGRSPVANNIESTNVDKAERGVDEDDDDDDDEDDENMRNVLSGSSRSSATTMPLLTEAHTHHSFSERISLEEYSPLTLVNDCDNALPMSPSSLACGSHHSSFKSSLNNLKMDPMGVDGVGEVGVHGVDDVVGDTRSMSPSLMSNPSGSHHSQPNLWSNSSTAISQNPSLLGSTSTPILLSQHTHHPSQHPHHHNHHQMNSLIQQLEPQSLDEQPQLIGINGNTSTLDSSLNIGPHSQLLLHRPSSEPPLNSSIGSLTNFEFKNNGSFGTTLPQTAAKSCSSSGRTRKQSDTSPEYSSNHSQMEATKLTPSGSSSSSSTSSRSSSGKSRSARSRVRNPSGNKGNATTKPVPDIADTIVPQEAPHSSRLHLQLNHHKKLQELQQRLFGNTAQTSSPIETKIRSEDRNIDGNNGESIGEGNVQIGTAGEVSKERVDSSANSGVVNSVTHELNPESSDALDDDSKSTTNKAIKPAHNKRKRPSRSQGTSKNNALTAGQESANSTARSNHKVVKTEIAEPDTTTKGSDCLKLANLVLLVRVNQ